MLLFCQASLDKLSRINDKLCKRNIKQFLMRKLGCVFWKTREKVRSDWWTAGETKTKATFPYLLPAGPGVFIWIDLCVHGGGDTYATMHVWRSKDNFWGSGLFFHHVGPRDWTWVIRFGSKTLTHWATSPDPASGFLSIFPFSITRRSVLGCPCPSEESFGSQIYQPLFQISSQLWFRFFTQESFSHDFPFYSRFILTASEALVISIAAQTACVWNALFLTLRFSDPVG